MDFLARYKRRDSRVGEALVETFLAGVSMRRGEDIPKALRGTRVSLSTMSELYQNIYALIGEWRQHPIEKHFV